MRSSSFLTPFFPPWSARLNALGRRRRSASPKVRFWRPATLAQIEERFAGALPDSLLTQDNPEIFCRERIFTLARTLWCWIWQVLQQNTSCREVVRQVEALFALHHAGPVDEGTAAYCKARSKLPAKLLEVLFGASFQSAEKAAAPTAPQLLGGRPIRVADGSGARLADTPDNRADYPPSKSLRAGTGFPYLRLVALFSLTSGALLAQASGSLHTAELSLWFKLLDQLRPGDIVLADRAYGIYVVIALLQSRGIDLIHTLPEGSRRIDFRKTRKRLGPSDALFVWEKPKQPSRFVPAGQWGPLPGKLTVRVLRARVGKKGFRSKELFLVTTLLDGVQYPAHELLAAHARRWRMEMSFDDLKTTLGMESLSCHSPAMIQKELLVFLIAHNLIRWLLANAAAQENVPTDRLSFKGTLDGFRQWSQAMAQCPKPEERQALWRQLLRTIAADALPHRPGRQEPRAVKKRSKYPPSQLPPLTIPGPSQSQRTPSCSKR